MGETLLEWCQETGTTQTELATAVGITQKHLSYVMNGRALLSPALAVRLARVTGMSAQLLFRLQGDRLIEIAIDDREAWDRFTAVMQKMLNTPPVKRRKFK